MKRVIFYLGYALRSLRRDGTRTFLAVLSVVVGVLSLVAMQLLSNALLHGAMYDQRLWYGGDAQLLPPNPGEAFTASDLDQLEAWQEQGLIANYTLVSNGSSAFLRTPTNSRVTFLANAIGIDTTTYPLAGEMLLRDPVGMTAADVLRSPNDVLVTRDIAEERQMQVGDTILLGGSSTPIELTVAGIVGATPSHQGDSVFYSLETARLVEGRDEVMNMASILWGSAPDTEQIIVDSPYRVFVALSRDDATQASSSLGLFDLMLKGAGVLGLLVGGMSVSNTLQVILARRKLEIAMLKTLGYRQRDLVALISLEAGLIGLVGGSVGAVIGALITGKLLDVLGSAGSLMLNWQPAPVIVLGGVLVGVLTAVFFGMQAILASSATRPVQLLRDLPLKIPRRTQIERLGLYVLVLLVFGVLVGVVLGSPLEGILYVTVGGLIVVLLRAVCWGVLWLVLKVPIPLSPVLRLARANLRQKKMQASLAVIALCAGAFSVSFAALTLYNAQGVIGRVRGSDEGYNVMVYTTPASTSDVVNQMIEQGGQDVYHVDLAQGLLNGQSMSIEGRDMADLSKNMHYEGEWPEAENIGLLPAHDEDRYTVGDSLVLRVNGQEETIRLVGFYTMVWNGLLWQDSGLIIPRGLLQHFTDAPLQTHVFGKFSVSTLSEVSTTLGKALPNTFIFSLADINEAMIANYRALFTFAVSVAGLAFVAGAVLIANTAGLTVVERRREIGVFKAVGYTSGHVLRVLLSEYGFLGILAGLFGITGTVAAITAINLAQPAAQLVVEPLILGAMLLFSIGIAVLSAAVVSWQPTRVRPLDVLRYE